MTLDTELIKAAKQGDQYSFSKLYEAVAPGMYKLALYTLGNAHDAEDVVSEAFMEAFRGLKNLRDEAAFKSWIYRILTVRCKRRIAEYIKGRNELDIDDFLHLPSGSSDIGADSVQSIELVGALSRLTVQERQIVVLSVLQGYTTKEIAQILSLPQGTVSSKLHRTLAKLRTMVR